VKFSWTDQRIAQLKAMVADGGTAGSIAAEWGTRNTIAGKMDRLGLRRGRSPEEPNRRLSRGTYAIRRAFAAWGTTP